MPTQNDTDVFPDQKDKETDGILLRTVILSRHGIRSPKESDTTLEKWSRKTWPKWPGNPGDLSPRGRELITAQWTALRPFFVWHGLLAGSSCPDSRDFSLIADEDERTRQTAMAIADGLAPGCHIRAAYGSRYDLLFHPDPAAYRVMDRQRALSEVEALLARVASDPAIGSAIDLLQEITQCCRPSFCGELGGTDSCTLQGLPSRMAIDPGKPKLDISGKWHTVSTLAEIMLLEYAEWPDRKPGWGMVDESVLRQLIPVHNGVFNATHRALSLAKAGGIHMLDFIRNTLLFGSAPKMTVLIGHDTNIAYVSGLLGINWHIPELGTDPIIPGSFLGFELWQNGSGGHEVRIFFNSPSLGSLHASPVTVTKPVRVPVDKGVYDVESFSKRVDSIIG